MSVRSISFTAGCDGRLTVGEKKGKLFFRLMQQAVAIPSATYENMVQKAGPAHHKL